MNKLAIPNLAVSVAEPGGLYHVVRAFRPCRNDYAYLVYLAAAATLAATATAAVAAPTAIKFKGDNLAPMACVTLAAARISALAARPGVITDQELEKEAGGSGLRYSFDIRNKGEAFEVGIDARTGHVLENKVEGPNAD